MNPKLSPTTNLPLQDIQANILQCQDKDFVRLILLEFKPGAEKKLRQVISNLARHVITSAQEQQSSPINFKSPKKQSSCPVVTFSLSYKGYVYLEVDPPNIPIDVAFRHGMQSYRTRTVLQDRDSNRWDHKYRFRFYHALLSIAADEEDVLNTIQKKVLKRFSGLLVEPVHWERGMKLYKEFPTRPGEKVAVEVFGFADGISQPSLDTDGDILKYVLLEESVKGRYGSYLVYRKIRQIKEFYKHLIDELLSASSLPINEQNYEFRQYIEAQIMGRFHDGTPVTSFAKPHRGADWDNDFDYSGDYGQKCPLHAHVRKTNPRFGKDDPRIVRRAIPYKEERENDEGLLFICYQRSIVEQFELIHQNLANSPFLGASKKISGKDPLMTYQMNKSPVPQRWNLGWGDMREVTFDKNIEEIIKESKHIVTLEGGEYFYTSSIPFLKELSLMV